MTPDIRDYLFEKIIVVPLMQINEKKKKKFQKFPNEGEYSSFPTFWHTFECQRKSCIRKFLIYSPPIAPISNPIYINTDA